jgi:hypothetical protein
MKLLPGAPVGGDGAPAPAGVQVRLRNVALFFASPFITLSHVAMLPFFLFSARSPAPNDPKAKEGRLS